MKSYEIDGSRLGQARQALVNEDGRPMKQVEFARLLDIHPVTLNRIENGKSKVSLDLLDKIADLTGKTREHLLGEPENVDEVELARERVSNALAQMSLALADIVDVLYGRAAEAKDVSKEKMA